MKVAIRVDASTQMGSGHVMRCRTLALALRQKGHEVRFVCRSLPGAMIPTLQSDGFLTLTLAAHTQPSINSSDYADWLGIPQELDAVETIKILDNWHPDWLVIDHYALGRAWEESLIPHVHRIAVIDDLANRSHDCALLIDQNLVFGRDTLYLPLLPKTTQCLLGPQYALVRPEFHQLRPFSLGRRKNIQLHRLLVFMGGSDPDNDTQKVLQGLQLATHTWRQIDVIVGSSYPFLADLKQSAQALPQAHVHVQTNQMAKLMTNADLAVTAGGTVSWEKCVLGLPSIVATSGENQVPIAESLHHRGAQLTLGHAANLKPKDYAVALNALKSSDLSTLSERAAMVCDGNGTQRIIDIMESY